jgi:class 3 adenylate cyclase
MRTMSRLTFRTKLLLAMLVVVVGGGFTTLVITQSRVQSAFARVYRQEFRRQIDYFATLQEARLESTREQCLKLAQSEAVVAALDRTEPDVTALYTLAGSEFNDGGPPRQGQRGGGGGATGPGRRNRTSFHRFVDAAGKPLLPAEGQGGRRFTVALRSRIESQAQYFSSAIASSATQQIAYLAVELETNELGGARFSSLRTRAAGAQNSPEDRPPVFQEIIVSKVLAADGARTLGALVLGLPMPDLVPQPPPEERGAVATTNRSAGLRAGMLYRGRMFANPAVLAEDVGARLAEAVEAQLARTSNVQAEFNLTLEGEPHRVFYQCMNPGSVFPPAYQVCLVSTAEAGREMFSLRLKIIAVSLGGLLGAIIFSLLLSHGLAAPLQRLTAGAHAIAEGNLDVRLPVRSADELGRLTGAFNEMAAGLALKEKYRTVLNMVADEKIAHRLMHGELALGGELREISVLFCDIRGFTPHTQHMPPAEVIEMLNEHMTALTAVVKAHHGVLDKFVGDLLMAVFGAPMHHENDAENAARCALALIAARAGLDRTSQHQLAIGIGVATGTVVAGCMGSSERMNYTVLGERVNLASRLCSSAAPGEVLVDEATLAKLGPRAQSEPKGEVNLKGFARPVHVYRLMAVDSGA